MLFKKENIPNFLSLFRILLVPVYIYLYITYHYRLSGAVFLLTGITDVVDGYIARKNGWVTDVGKLLDPLADKLIQISAIACLTWLGTQSVHLPKWMFFIIIIKEMLQITGAAFILGEKKKYAEMLPKNMRQEYIVCPKCGATNCKYKMNFEYRYITDEVNPNWEEGICFKPDCGGKLR